MKFTRNLSIKRTWLLFALMLAFSSVRTVNAAFPGSNGSIAFASNRDGNFEIYVMNLTAQARHA